MLKKPYHGAAGIQFFDIDFEFFTNWDFDNAPILWLKSCKHGLEHNSPITLEFIGDDVDAKVIADERHTSILHTLGGGESLYVYEGYGKMNLTEDIVMDINRDFESWIWEWYDYECLGLRDLSHEDIEFRNKCQRVGEDFRRNEKVELRLKTALRETESAWMRRRRMSLNSGRLGTRI